jgi:hypothetical protein
MDQKPAVQKPVTSLRKLANLIRERWPEYVVEIAVIIFSISISFALDEWKDRQQKQELEQLYLKELARDIDADIRQLNGIIAETKQVAQKANGLIKLSQQESQPVYSQFVNDVRFIFKRPRFVAQDATFSDLKSSGNLQTMRSFPLKNALFDYYKHYESIVLVETAELESTNVLVGPYLLKRLPFLNENNVTPKVNLAAIIHEVEFQNTMLVRLSTREELLRDYEQISKQGQRILTSIKSQIRY